jgi:hypothetical protein
LANAISPDPLLLSDIELAAIIRPHQVDWYRRVLANIRKLARELGINDDAICTWIGQTRGHKGIANAYELRRGSVTRCFSGWNHEPVIASSYRIGNLRGPISRAQIVKWMESCPDYNHPTIYRPRPESHPHA